MNNYQFVQTFPLVPGIYKITNPSGKIYIGESVSLKTRCLDYFTLIKIKKQPKIYNSILKYSIENHIFEILEICTKEELKSKERYWQDYYDVLNKGLNCILTGYDEVKPILSKESCNKISISQTGINNSFYNKKHNKKSLEKISLNSKGVNNSNYGGKTITDVWRKNQSLSQSKKPLLIIDTFLNKTFTFNNSKEASLYLKCKHSTLRTAKCYNYKLQKRYIIQDLIIEK
jgi:group I intron endonuclease